MNLSQQPKKVCLEEPLSVWMEIMTVVFIPKVVDNNSFQYFLVQFQNFEKFL